MRFISRLSLTRKDGDENERARVMNKPDYHFDLIMDDGDFIGVMLYWETDDLVYLELKILSYPYIISAEEYSKFRDYLHKEVEISSDQ